MLEKLRTTADSPRQSFYKKQAKGQVFLKDKFEDRKAEQGFMTEDRTCDRFVSCLKKTVPGPVSRF